MGNTLMGNSNFRLRVQQMLKPDSLGRRLLQGSGWATVAKIGTIGSGALTNMLVTRILSPDEVGDYYLAFSIVTTSTLVGQLGLDRTVIRLLGEAKGKAEERGIRETIYTTLRLGLGASLAVALLYLVWGNQIVSLFDSTTLAVVTPLIALAIVPIAIGNLLSNTFRGLQEFKYAELYGGRGVLKGVLVSIGFGFFWLFKDDTTLSEALAVMAVSGLTSTALAATTLYLKIRSIPSDGTQLETQKVLSIAWPILLANLVPVLSNQSVLWILAGLRASSDVAVFGAAMKLLALLSIPTLVYSQVVAPFMAELYTQGRRAALQRMLRYVATLTTAVTVLLALPVFLRGGDVLSFVYGDFYRAGAATLAFLATAQLINVATGPCGQLLLMTGYHHYFFRITLFAGTLAIIVSYLLIGQLGYIGAALGQSIYTTVTTLLAAYYSYRLTGIKSWIGLPRDVLVKARPG